jgi:gliding motility-associated-like protein
MKKGYSHIFCIILCFWSYSVYSQINCTVPLPPVLTLVSVQPETGITEFNWTLSPSSGVSAYLLYTYHDENGIPRGDIIDTIRDPSATSYLYTSTSYKYYSSSYVVAAYKPPVIPGMDGCPSTFSNVLNTIFAKAVIDTCNNKIKVTWNSYISFPKKVISYSVLLSVNEGSYTEAMNLSPDKNDFTLNNFTIDAQYCFVIRANLEDDTFSTSHKTCLTTKMQRPPGWINADYATVNSDNKIALSFTVDPSSEITHYSLERKNRQSGTFQEIAQPVSTNGSVIYIDNTADINVLNSYRLSAVNSCNIPVTVSNVSSNIVISLERNGNDINLSWNSYKDWLGTIFSYRVFVNTGTGFEEKVELQPADTVYRIGYSEIMYEVTGNDICFYVSATESSNPHGVTGQSNSSTVCMVPIETITVPNVFTPNKDLVNDFFKPVLSFIPVNYHLVISDRQGKILFETRDYDAVWDGTQGGNPQQEGVCLWFLKVTTPSGKSISKTGTLTLIGDRK